jgi:hypothetical protein
MGCPAWFPIRWSLLRQENLKIAQRFNAGMQTAFDQVPQGRLMFGARIQSSLRDLARLRPVPGFETPGYYQLSRWDK